MKPSLLAAMTNGYTHTQQFDHAGNAWLSELLTVPGQSATLWLLGRE